MEERGPLWSRWCWLVPASGTRKNRWQNSAPVKLHVFGHSDSFCFDHESNVFNDLTLLLFNLLLVKRLKLVFLEAESGPSEVPGVVSEGALQREVLVGPSGSEPAGGGAIQPS